MQGIPHLVPQIPVVDGVHHLPLPDQDLSETNFIFIKPVLPEIKVSTLKNAMFFLPDAEIKLVREHSAYNEQALRSSLSETF